MRSRAWGAVIVAVLGFVALGAQPVGAQPVPWRKMQRAINEVRAEHGLRPVRRAPRLQKAARRHSRDMLRHRYFGHTSSGGVGFATRIRRSGFKTVGAWSAGEAIGWGAGRRGRVRPVLRAWMRSRSHRAIILTPRFRLVGIGRVRGGPWRGHADARLWTADFATR
jgi:uncharacterized protein YkwD